MKTGLKDKAAGYYASALTMVLAIVTCVIYATATAKVNSPVIIALLAVGAAMELLVLIKPVSLLCYIPFIFFLLSIILFIPLAFDEVGDVLSKINMNGLSASWIASAVLILLTAVVSGVSTVLDLKKVERIKVEVISEA